MSKNRSLRILLGLEFGRRAVYQSSISCYSERADENTYAQPVLEGVKFPFFVTIFA